MNLLDRYLAGPICKDLEKKMVFVGGPRQVGKTTLSLGLLGRQATEKHRAYFNWDHPLVPSRLRNMELPPEEPLLVFDEIHKYARWRNLIKGIYDTEKTSRKILVTGSARLNHYRKEGDSLANRYRYFRLHPLSVREINDNPTPEDLRRLIRWGGFPEPFLAEDDDIWRIWQRDRISRVVREDLRDLERVHEVSLIEHLVELLPARVGSPLSLNGLREDLSVDHKTVARWVSILENLYLCFRISPFGGTKIRAVKKERKLYLWDWTMIREEGIRFENLVASQLLKYCHWLEDTKGFAMELCFLRDTDKREVDFVVLKEGEPLFAVECKTGERKISPAIRYFAERTTIPHFYQVHLEDRHYEQGRMTVLPFLKFCQQENMP